MPKIERVGVHKLVWEKNRWLMKGFLAVDASGAGFDGEWVRVDGIHPITIGVEGTFVGEVRVYGSQNPVNAPGSGAGFAQVGVPYTGPGSFQTDGPWMWLKIRLPAWTSGTVKVGFYANIPWGS